jgi:FHS family L-fucose permease-like MFS transporter
MSDGNKAATQGTNQLDSGEKPPVVPKHYLLPFILTTCCFSLWGFANDFTNPLVKVFEQVFIITTSQASWLQFAFYTGYFCMALPAAFFIRKFSYKGAIMVGFAFYAIGALLAIPASMTATFGLFLLGSYILTYGLAFLETACNPYILAMGPKETATQRLNLAQAFNPIGSLIGMFVASQLLAPNLLVTKFQDDIKDGKEEVVKYLVQDESSLPTGATMKAAEGESKDKFFVLDDDLKTEVKLYDGGIPNFDTEVGALGGATTNAMKVFRETNPDGFKELQQADLGYVRTPYVVVAGVVLAFLAIFTFSKMPTFKSEQEDAPFLEITARIFGRPRFLGGVIAQLFYVGAQIMCWTFVVHYGMEYVGLTLAEAQSYNIVAMVIFLLSRWICTFLLRIFSPGRMLCGFAIGGIAFTLGAIYLPGQTGLISLVMISACMSLMFPTIYGIALNGMEEEEAKLGSAYLIMSIVGGAVLTKLQGGMIDDYGVRTSFWLPLGCFVVIAIYGLMTFMVFEPKANREAASA